MGSHEKSLKVTMGGRRPDAYETLFKFNLLVALQNRLSHLPMNTLPMLLRRTEAPFYERRCHRGPERR